jgi:hypothetical protein
MLLTTLLLALPATLIFTATVHGSPTKHLIERALIDDFIDTQRERSMTGVLDNLGPVGSKATGAPAGILVASPSRTDPNCMSLLSRLLFSSPLPHTGIMPDLVNRLLDLDPRLGTDLQGID